VAQAPLPVVERYDPGGIDHAPKEILVDRCCALCAFDLQHSLGESTTTGNTGRHAVSSAGQSAIGQ
jgi:hypothetical protein